MAFPFVHVIPETMRVRFQWLELTCSQTLRRLSAQMQADRSKPHDGAVCDSLIPVTASRRPTKRANPRPPVALACINSCKVMNVSKKICSYRLMTRAR